MKIWGLSIKSISLLFLGIWFMFEMLVGFYILILERNPFYVIAAGTPFVFIFAIYFFELAGDSIEKDGFKNRWKL